MFYKKLKLKSDRQLLSRIYPMKENIDESVFLLSLPDRYDLNISFYHGKPFRNLRTIFKSALLFGIELIYSNNS
jgi:hypothetical protein